MATFFERKKNQKPQSALWQVSNALIEAYENQRYTQSKAANRARAAGMRTADGKPVTIDEYGGIVGAEYVPMRKQDLTHIGKGTTQKLEKLTDNVDRVLRLEEERAGKEKQRQVPYTETRDDLLKRIQEGGPGQLEVLKKASEVIGEMMKNKSTNEEMIEAIDKMQDKGKLTAKEIYDVIVNPEKNKAVPEGEKVAGTTNEGVPPVDVRLQSTLKQAMSKGATYGYDVRGGSHSSEYEAEDMWQKTTEADPSVYDPIKVDIRDLYRNADIFAALWPEAPETANRFSRAISEKESAIKDYKAALDRRGTGVEHIGSDKAKLKQNTNYGGIAEKTGAETKNFNEVKVSNTLGGGGGGGGNDKKDKDYVGYHYDTEGNKTSDQVRIASKDGELKLKNTFKLKPDERISKDLFDALDKFNESSSIDKIKPGTTHGDIVFRGYNRINNYQYIDFDFGSSDTRSTGLQAVIDPKTRQIIMLKAFPSSSVKTEHAWILGLNREDEVSKIQSDVSK